MKIKTDKEYILQQEFRDVWAKKTKETCSEY